jgi:sugar-specific transcriptional regulator TrmB
MMDKPIKTIAELKVLSILERDGWTTAYDLRIKAGVSSGTIYDMMKRLEDKGFVQRRPSEQPYHKNDPHALENNITHEGLDALNEQRDDLENIWE